MLREREIAPVPDVPVPHPERQKRRWLRWWSITLVVVLLLLLIPTVGFVIWAETPLGPSDVALAALNSDAHVQVKTDPWLSFTPTQGQPTTGFIFYPGARVDARSYAPAMRAIAQQGYLTVIVPMPLNLAIFAPAAANDVIPAFPGITHWVIGGHSMGGAMAANYTHDNVTKVQGIALWAAYPQASDSLADQTLAATAIFGTSDGLVDPSERQKAIDFMPKTMQVVLIEGGNHAQFGSYGPQPSDNPATISAEEQERQTVTAMLALLGTITE